jgi:serine/threonine protein phosphatase PrpC/serine/threonine protein kinase
MGCGGSVQRKVGVEAKSSQKGEEKVKDSPRGSVLDLAQGFIDRRATSSAKLIAGSIYTKIINERCSLIRLDHCAETKKIPVQGKNLSFNLEYCYVSQRGYYPTSLNKANQDSYLICENFLGEMGTNLFGVFDGHGETGDHCSFFSADKLPEAFAIELKKNGGLSAADNDKFCDIYTRSFLNTNFELHDSNIDDSLSGTTAITIFQRGDKLYIANVGDSRAVIATEVGGELKASPLSSDQTPYRKDERERLKKAGAKIMTMDQIEGYEPVHENYGTGLGDEIDQGGDPPRVWDASLEKPGCAFSRSIGDAVGKSVGVTAEPEILEWTISADDRYAVIASDGVFEFITSQGVIDMINKYDNILEAAKHVVAESYRLWLTYDDRTDDITIIIIAFQDIKKNMVSSSPTIKKKMNESHRGMSMTRGLSSADLTQSRPVRKVMSKAKRKDIAEHWSKEDNIKLDFDNIPNTKTQEEIAKISTIFSTSFMFQNISPIQKDHIYKVLTPRDISAHEFIIREGDQGDEMYIVDSGEYQVWKRNESGQDQLIHEYKQVGEAFGELSLMYGKPRAASVQAKIDGKLWCIGRAAFRAVMLRGQNEGLLDIFRTIPVLHELSIPALHRICVSSKEHAFQKGDVIVKESTADSVPWSLCVILTGVVRLLPKEEGKKRELRAELSYFSIEEIGTKFTDAVADGKVRIICVPQEVYNDVLGDKGGLSMKENVLKKKSKGKRLPAMKNPFAVEENLRVDNRIQREDLELDNTLSFIDDFGYFANFIEKKSQMHFSVKVYVKNKSVTSRMEKRIVHERNILATITNICGITIAGLPNVLATLQDSKYAYVVLRENFVCDLSLAIHNHAVVDEARPYYAACIYSAISRLHDLGLIHRLINPSSVYITKSGMIKIADFRFAKIMDGSYRVTICGDPLYFAPEIIAQQGYDYAVDLWAYGVLLYEMYEGSTPFGNSDTDETSIFRAITSFRASRLNFNRAPHEARKLITSLMQSGNEERAGYKDPNVVFSSDFFNGIKWEELERTEGHPIDIQPTLDVSSLLDDQQVQPLASSNNAFESF